MTARDQERIISTMTAADGTALTLVRKLSTAGHEQTVQYRLLKDGDCVYAAKVTLGRPGGFTSQEAETAAYEALYSHTYH